MNPKKYDSYVIVGCKIYNKKFRKWFLVVLESTFPEFFDRRGKFNKNHLYTT